ncbi:MAG: ATP-binding protein [Clostridia bacterium]|nr:ATP-binding protein [Clostridia bacterium]MDD4047446.1 ATP-binding protein [Clostridia bacterium]
MREISLHILDIVQNSLAAQAKNIGISIIEDTEQNKMYIEIKDDGKGMDKETINKVLDPFYTTRTTRKVGLGLSLLQANARTCGGDLTIESIPGKGTIVRTIFCLDHIDRPPLGNMATTLISIMSGSSDVEFSYQHQCDKKCFSISTQEIKEHLNDIPVNNPEVLAWLLEYFTEKEKALSE